MDKGGLSPPDFIETGNVLVEVDATVGELPEGSLLLKFSCLLGVLVKFMSHVSLGNPNQLVVELVRSSYPGRT